MLDWARGWTKLEKYKNRKVQEIRRKAISFELARWYSRVITSRFFAPETEKNHQTCLKLSPLYELFSRSYCISFQALLYFRV